LQSHHPDYLHFSVRLDAHLHAVPIPYIIMHHQPRQRLQDLIKAVPHDAVEQDLYQLAHLFKQQGLDLAGAGVTGSVLIGVHNPGSDIDLVCYDRPTFQHCRALVRDLTGHGVLAALGDEDWQASYQRRAADLSYAEYVWHEQRKHNKALVNGRKFDLSLMTEAEPETGGCQKRGTINLRCRIIDDTHGFDYPARFQTDHPTINMVISFTATYVGQAFKNEWVEISGTLEQTSDGSQRIVVGANREARGEFIKVIR
jgi:predicted nucleotidyltransferase